MNYGQALNLALSGKDEGYEFLYNETFQKSYYVALKYMKNEDAALDVLQEAYAKAFSSLEQLENANKFPAWFSSIVASKSLDALRKKNVTLFSQMGDEESEVVDFIEDNRIEVQPELALDQAETSRIVQEILDGLSEEQRFCIMMYYMDQMSVKEIAQALGVSENTVKSRLNYGRKNIKGKVQELEKKGVKLLGLAPVAFFAYLLMSNTQTVQAAARGAVKKVKKGVANTLLDIGSDVIKGGTKMVKSAMKDLIDTGSDQVADRVKDIVGSNVKSVSKSVNKLIDANIDKADGLVDSTIKKATKGVDKAVDSTLDKATKGVDKVVGSTLDKATERVDQVADVTINKTTKGVGRVADQSISKASASAKDVIDTGLDGARQTADGVIADGVGAINASAADISGNLNTTLNATAGDITSNLGATLNATAGDITGNLNSTLNGTVGDITGNLNSTLNGTVGDITGNLNGTWNTAMGDITNNLNGTVNNMAGDVTNNVNQAVNANLDGLKDSISDGTDKAKKAAEMAADLGTSAAKSAIEIGASLYNKLGDKAKDILSDIDLSNLHPSDDSDGSGDTSASAADKIGEKVSGLFDKENMKKALALLGALIAAIGMLTLGGKMVTNIFQGDDSGAFLGLSGKSRLEGTWGLVEGETDVKELKFSSDGAVILSGSKYGSETGAYRAEDGYLSMSGSLAGFFVDYENIYGDYTIKGNTLTITNVNDGEGGTKTLVYKRKK
ncbi:MAG: sigma-70 family RNA polymerase sigma factor [Lachnospiraceae bacterium]|nr:sigma-70 family RNA polymerase sigma factor [bacterium]MDY5516506.1 sigma-70 family RNA polymerase sigma factor [Lachnospiraceae bacterium]